MKRKLISWALICCMLISLLPMTALAADDTGDETGETASGTCGDNLTWELDENGTLTISGTGAMDDWQDYGCVPWFSNRSSVKTAVIEDGVTTIGPCAFWDCFNMISVTVGDDVITINNHAFEDCHSLSSITIPNSVTSIENNAFGMCHSLSSVTIGNSVTSIGDYAFYYCTGLVGITIPDSVTVIGDCVFDGCVKLTNITVDENNPDYASEGGVLFNKSKTMLLTYPRDKEGTYTIPDSVTTVGNCAFNDCDGLTGVTIPDSVTTVGNYAFNDCDGLTDITIPNSVTAIGDRAFCGCDDLTDIIIPNSVISIGVGAFLGCINLTGVTIPDSITAISDMVFCNCKNLTDITIPKSVTSIGVGAFDGCGNLTDITIPSSVTSIGNGAFWECTSLTDVYYGGSETDRAKMSIDNSANINDYLLNATWHYAENSSGDDTSDDPTDPGTSDDSVADQVKDILDELIGGTVDNIQDVLEDLSKGDLKDAINALGDEIFDRLEELENSIQGSAEIEVEAGLGIVSTQVKVTGAKLNFDYEKEVTLKIGSPEDEDITVPEQASKDFRFSMQLIEGANNNVMELVVPIKVTLPVPSLKLRPQSLKLWHFHNGQLVPVTLSSTPYQDESGQWFVSFVIDGFSDFIMTYDEETATTGGGSSGGASGSAISGTAGSAGSGSVGSTADTPATPETPDTTNPFTDVSSGAYYYDAVQWAINKGITTGRTATTFDPDGSCTRAQMVTFLWRCAGEPEPESTDGPFADVADTAYYYKAVLWAVEQGITNGTSDTTFEPDQAVTRAQMVTVLYRYADEPAVSSSDSFTDVEGGKYFTDAIQWAVANNITTGYDDSTFRPYNDCTRAQIMTFMYRDFAEVSVA